MNAPARIRGLGPAHWFALILLLFALPAWAAPRIGVLTFGPGNEYWSRFGHNAVLVESEQGERRVYNYGFFDFEQPDFLLRFIRGRMLYQLVELPFERDLGYYAAEGRSAELQWLRLDAAEAQSLADFLHWNAQPENAEYRYDYFRDNCSTRVRDALDRVLGGELRRQTQGRSRGLTARNEALRLSVAEPWMFWGIHLALGPSTDQPLSRWDEAFVPQHLQQALRLVQRRDGQPLVLEELQLLPQRVTPSAAAAPRPIAWALGIGLGLAWLLWLLVPRDGWRGRLGRGLLALLWVLCGCAGLLMLGLWWGTDHSAAAANRGLWLFSPLCLLLLPLLGQLRAERSPSWLLRLLAGLLFTSSLIGLAYSWLPVRPQDFREWLYLLLPIHAAVLLLSFRRRSD